MALFFYKEKNKDIRAAAYLRLSIEDGDKAESNSIGNQRELIRDFAAERPGLHLVEEYADDGYTGTNFERPGFKRMMEDIKSGKINCIIVKDLSRLGRNYIEMGKYLEQIFPMMGMAALQNQKAVYLITDRSNGKLYVGSATSDNGMLLQRWENHIDSGHGGNKELIELVNKEGIDYIKRNFQYSVLENYNAKVDDSVILERESWWKETLQSRKFGYNAN